MAHRAMAVTETRTVGGLDLSESASSQCRPCRIQNDNNKMDALSRKTDEFLPAVRRTFANVDVVRFYNRSHLSLSSGDDRTNVYLSLIHI